MKVFCPLPRRYAVIQMDPVGMVRRYDDPIALAAAKAIKPRKYLVYLRVSLDVPTPTNPWFRFEVDPIATTLRPEDREHGITPDMVVPIYPNTRHLRGRTPVQTETPFPFPNCYHWIRNRMIIRIRRKAIRYDDATALIVSIPNHRMIDHAFYDDYDRILAFQEKRAAVTKQLPSGDETSRPSTPGEPSRAHRISQGPEWEDRLVCVDANDGDVDSLPSGPRDFNDCATSFTTSATSLHTLQRTESHNSIVEILNLDAFGFNVDHDASELIPLVDMWFELTDHITADTIPSPTGLYQEWDTIMRIIHDARERAPSIQAPFVDSGISIDYDDLSILCGGDVKGNGQPRQATSPDHIVGAADVRRPRVFDLRAIWRRLRPRKPLFGSDLRTPWGLRPPGLPYWP
ncbi:hypothetical protein C8Q79DRAFT_752778 [Trametes meyenii]|nr:hypothetical protein C8Q79DRAFT_752778 [Trametes meyenii]